MKYYCNPNGGTFAAMYEKNELGRRLIGFDGQKPYHVFKCGEIIPYDGEDATSFNNWLINRYIMPASDKLLKEFGLIKNSFYIAKSGKPFSAKVGGEFSKYVWEKKENGDWEPAMIEGQDYNAYYDAGTQRARVFDEKVESGLWIKAEVEVKE